MSNVKIICLAFKPNQIRRLCINYKHLRLKWRTNTFPCLPLEFPHHPVVGAVVRAGLLLAINIPSAEPLII